jgi:hypothetical protein
MIIEKCVYCNQEYNSTIDKSIDICPNCERTEYEDYDNPEFKEMIMTYNDQTLSENK